MGYIQRKPEPSLFAIAIIIGTFVAYARITINILREYIAQRAVLKGTGLIGYYPPDNLKGKKEVWASLRAELERNPPNDLSILVLTGAQTFGNRDAPLYEVIKTYKGNGYIHLLLINPCSDAFLQRVHELGIPKDSYLKLLEETIIFCKHLTDGRLKDKIVIRLYDQMPIWKMIFTEKYLWLQSYGQGSPVDQSPIYNQWC